MDFNTRREFTVPQNLEAIATAVPISGLVRPLMAPKTKALVFCVALIVLCTDVGAGDSVASVAVSALVRNACSASTLAQDGTVRAVAAISATGELSVACASETPSVAR